MVHSDVLSRSKYKYVESRASSLRKLEADEMGQTFLWQEQSDPTIC